MTRSLLKNAARVLKQNDHGRYTVPTHGLYPFQWNWDSCLAALGLARIDEARGWTELDTLFESQWEDGMVPHIVFHKPDDGYFPGPAVWRAGRRPPTSGITQPPIAGFVVSRLFDRAADREQANARAAALAPKIARWHDWFYQHRDPLDTGLVAIIHPWESGRDNAVDWDDALDRVPTDGVAPFTRRDTRHADPAHRPTQAQYTRYIYLIELFRALDWDNTRLHDASPFKIVDPGLNAVLIRSCEELARLGDALGQRKIARRSREQMEKGVAAMESLWSARLGRYLCFDRTTGEWIDSPSVGGLTPAFAPIPRSRVAAIARRLADLGRRVDYLVPSHDPADPRFDRLRYWRGPAWPIVNYMLACGMRRAGEDILADRIRADTIRLMEKSGFAEYYNPFDGAPCGGDSFTWSAAMALEFLFNTAA